jgi:transcriptional regulator with XRE-family HTH domain
MKPRYEVAVGFGENLRRLRRGAGLSQEELSFLSSVHRTDISKIERGESLPRTDTLLKLAGGLGVPAQELLDGLAWEPPPAAPLPWGSFRVAPIGRSHPQEAAR